MNRKPSIFERIADFVTGKGFYFIVLACVAAIGLSGYFLVRGVRQGLADGQQDQPVGGSAHIVVTPTPGLPSQAPASASPQASPSAPAQSAQPTPSAQPEPSPSAQSANLVFTWPVSGAVIVPFSLDVLAYDETMGDWRTHNGLDIAAELDTRVLATAEGTVSAIYDDPLMGTTLVIEHGNGLTSLYANLTDTPAVQVGDPVYTGTIIGAVGNTAPAESGRADHLHFAMYQDGQAVNPENYLPEK
ncbi:MAG TPA: peptidoglycan DD-metalloendopeptidase family protein [Firmicutes bacterium]|nr:peptidoglycan DD-metalloendopeptidase family protein [Bacillota bacterium]